MACKLRSIHALNGCNAAAVITSMGNEHGVFKYISAPVKIAEEEISAGIFGAFVIAKSALPFVLT